MLFSSVHKSLLFIGAVTGLATPALFSQDTQAQTDTQEIIITFDGRVGDEQFSCGETYSGLGSSEAAVTATDFRFYVSDVAVIDVEGNPVPVELEQDGKWQYQNVALLDFEDKTGACANGTVETRNIVVGTVPQVDYRGLQFTLGVPSQLNHEDAAIAPSPLNLTSMWWNWQGGYKFLRVDWENRATAMNNKQMNHGEMNHGEMQHGETERNVSSNNTFLIHIGSTGCQETGSQSYECSNPNRSDVVLENFDPENNVVVADLANLVSQADLTSNQPDTPAGCMSSPEDMDCMPIFNNLGLSFNEETVEELTFFRVE
ncbi:MbnP family copper-binding protein [Myxosarcina sp. GI1(2024)]